MFWLLIVKSDPAKYTLPFASSTYNASILTGVNPNANVCSDASPVAVCVNVFIADTVVYWYEYILLDPGAVANIYLSSPVICTCVPKFSLDAPIMFCSCVNVPSSPKVNIVTLPLFVAVSGEPTAAYFLPILTAAPKLSILLLISLTVTLFASCNAPPDVVLIYGIILPALLWGAPTRAIELPWLNATACPKLADAITPLVLFVPVLLQGSFL